MGRDAGRGSLGGIYGRAEIGPDGCGERAGDDFCKRVREQLCGRLWERRSKNEMSMGAAPTSPGGTTSSAAAEQWHKLLDAELRSSAKFTENFYERLRKAKLTFGDRVH